MVRVSIFFSAGRTKGCVPGHGSAREVEGEAPLCRETLGPHGCLALPRRLLRGTRRRTWDTDASCLPGRVAGHLARRQAPRAYRAVRSLHARHRRGHLAVRALVNRNGRVPRRRHRHARRQARQCVARAPNEWHRSCVSRRTVWRENNTRRSAPPRPGVACASSGRAGVTAPVAAPDPTGDRRPRWPRPARDGRALPSCSRTLQAAAPGPGPGRLSPYNPKPRRRDRRRAPCGGHIGGGASRGPTSHLAGLVC